jgi:hypothetical protein
VTTVNQPIHATAAVRPRKVGGVRFSGEVWYWRGPAPYHFVTIPEEQSAELGALAADVSYGWGMIPVRVRAGATEWTTSLWPKDGGYVVPLKDAVRTAEELDIGDVVALELDVRPRR